jgi:hypothetical protein
MARWPWSKSPRPVLSYRKSGGMLPADNETLEIRSDASFTLWRTNAEAVQPPAPVGRFAGTVPDFEGLQKLARAAAAVPVEDTQFPPDAAVETVGLETSRHRWAEPLKLPGAWAALAGRLRELLVTLTDQPAGAVALEREGATARLVHLGPDVIELNLRDVQLRAVHWNEDGTAEEDWRQPLEGQSQDPINAGAGWSLDLPLPQNDDPAGGALYVDNLLAFDGQFWTACSLVSGSLASS